MPLPDGMTEKEGKTIVVYRLESDGSLTRCDTTVCNGKVTFKTNHFSTFILAEQDTSAVAPDTSDAGTNRVLFALAMFLLGGCAVKNSLITVSKKIPFSIL
jgi:hypothetical protein